MSDIKNRRSRKDYSSDVFMRKLWNNLVKDFRTVTSPDFCKSQERSLRDGIKQYRQKAWPSAMHLPTFIFKRQYQMQSLFKRYRFDQDLYNGTELDELTDSKFVKCQVRLASTPLNLGSSMRGLSTLDVIQRARHIISRILGDYDVEEHLSLCRFGKRASVGCSAASSYIDLKLTAKQLTGSHDHIKWMRTVYLPQDQILAGLLTQRADNGTMWEVCESLKQTNVAKSYKSYRGICPNTLIGSFYTYGLGRVFQDRLEAEGLDIRFLQDEHKFLARAASVDRKKATTDLSEASNSFYADVVNMLLPRKWYKVTKLGRLDRVDLPTVKDVKLMSFMTMGIGFTFPLQTLLFYGLLQAIRELLHLKGRISVFGDDLIYPTKMHECVVFFFQELRLLVNEEKTFVESPFRESCGGDYHRGIDVRPFQPEGQSGQLTRAPYLAFIYKTINGLKDRWDDSEIPITLHWLKREILRVTDSIFQVPYGYPAYSGIKVKQPECTWYEGYEPIVRCFMPGDKEPYMWEFKCLRQCADKRIVANLDSYFWDSLRAKSQGEGREQTPLMEFEKSVGRHIAIDGFVVHGDPYDAPGEATLIWENVKNYSKNYRSKLTGKRLQRKRATVALKGPSRLVSSKGLTSCWTRGVTF